MKTIDTALINEILTAMNNSRKNGLSHFGVRGDDVDINVGDELDASYDWDYENDCQSDEKLDGTCATEFEYLWFDGEQEDVDTVKKALEYNINSYRYSHLSIVAGVGSDYGSDSDEVIIEGATVIYKIN